MNKVFNELYNNIKNFNNIFIEYFKCPVHSILSCNMFNNFTQISYDNIYKCMLCSQELKDLTIYKYEFKKLNRIYNLFKQIDKTNLYYNSSYNITYYNLIQYYNMLLWLLENSIKDYDIIKDETIDIYYKLQDTYKHINNENYTENYNTINVENIIYIENNIELCKQIMYILNLNNTTFDTFFMFKSYYLFALFNDINKFIKQINHYLIVSYI